MDSKAHRDLSVILHYRQVGSSCRDLCCNAGVGQAGCTVDRGLSVTCYMAHFKNGTRNETAWRGMRHGRFDCLNIRPRREYHPEGWYDEAIDEDQAVQVQENDLM